MKTTAFIGLAAVLSLPSTITAAQTAHDHAKHATTPRSAADSASVMADGEVRRVDKDNGKITLKHGEIKNLDMPPMTMVFNVKEKTLLENIRVGDKVKFSAISEEGKYIVVNIAPTK
jgi:Cu(I)/Ag(I) efflux system periplasmic protein CusF